MNECHIIMTFSVAPLTENYKRQLLIRVGILNNSELTSDETNNNTADKKYFHRMDIFCRKKHDARCEIQDITKY